MQFNLGQPGAAELAAVHTIPLEAVQKPQDLDSLARQTTGPVLPLEKSAEPEQLAEANVLPKSSQPATEVSWGVEFDDQPYRRVNDFGNAAIRGTEMAITKVVWPGIKYGWKYGFKTLETTLKIAQWGGRFSLEHHPRTARGWTVLGFTALIAYAEIADSFHNDAPAPSRPVVVDERPCPAPDNQLLRIKTDQQNSTLAGITGRLNRQFPQRGYSAAEVRKLNPTEFDTSGRPAKIGQVCLRIK